MRVNVDEGCQICGIFGIMIKIDLSNFVPHFTVSEFYGYFGRSHHLKPKRNFQPQNGVLAEAQLKVMLC